MGSWCHPVVATDEACLERRTGHPRPGATGQEGVEDHRASLCPYRAADGQHVSLLKLDPSDAKAWNAVGLLVGRRRLV